MPITGGSDAHAPEELARYHTNLQRGGPPQGGGLAFTVRTRGPGLTVLPFYEAASRRLTLELDGTPAVAPPPPAAALGRVLARAWGFAVLASTVAERTWQASAEALRAAFTHAARARDRTRGASSS